MFKDASDKQNFITRTASHATKEHRSGRIDAIPEWAEKPEEYYNSLKEQFESLRDQLRDANTRIEVVASKLKQTLVFKEYEPLQRERDRLTEIIRTIQPQIQVHRELLRAVAHDSWATMFYACAKLILDEEEFNKIDDETANTLRRRHQEYKAPEQINHQTKRNGIKKKRHNFREKYKGNASTLVWSDERGGVVSADKAHIGKPSL